MLLQNAKAEQKMSPHEAAKLVKMVICKKCYTQFLPTASMDVLNQHIAEKHPDFGFDKSFPELKK
jgi:hypothetical protein